MLNSRSLRGRTVEEGKISREGNYTILEVTNETREEATPQRLEEITPRSSKAKEQKEQEN